MSSLPPPPEKVPPHSEIAEKALLGCLISMYNGDGVGAILDTLPDEAMYREAHQRILAAVRRVHIRQQPVDIVTVADDLRTAGHLDFCGGAVYLDDLALGVQLTTDGAPAYAQTVKGYWRMRELIRLTDRIQGKAYSAGEADIAATLKAAEEQVLALTAQALPSAKVTTLQQAMKTAYLRVKAASEPSDPFADDVRLTMPWQDLAGVVKGIRTGEVVFVGAHTGMGKTAFALQLTDTWAAQGHAGLIFSQEMDAPVLGLRALLQGARSVTQDDVEAMYDGNEAHHKRVLKGLGEPLRDKWQHTVFIDDTPSVTLAGMDATLRRVARSSDTPLRWCVLDYIGLMHSTGRRTGNRAEEMKELAYGLLELARKHHVVMVAISQLRRLQEKPRIPCLQDFYEGGGVEHAAQCAIVLYRPSDHGQDECEAAGFPDAEQWPGFTRAMVLKQRGGAHGTALLWFDGGNYRFRACADNEWQVFLAAQKAHAAKRETKKSTSGFGDKTKGRSNT